MTIGETRFVIVDTETTGVDPKVDRVVELAMLEATDPSSDASSFQALVNPQMPIPCTASAVHHIVDEDVAGAPTLELLTEDIAAFARDDAVFVAHNAEFDRAFLPMLANHRWLCTQRLAQHLMPDAPAFGNQVLRYHFGARIQVGNTHRALADCHVSAYVLRRLLDRYIVSGRTNDLATLLAFAASPILLVNMPFGKHRGAKIADVPSDYLLWALRSMADMGPDLRYTFETEITRRRAPAA